MKSSFIVLNQGNFYLYIQVWRRAYDIPPPQLEESSEYNPRNDNKYKVDIRTDLRGRILHTCIQNLDRRVLPLTECLKDTVERALPYWHDAIVPAIRSGQKVLIAAHGNSLRALIKYLDNVPDAEIVELNLPTGMKLFH